MPSLVLSILLGLVSFCASAQVSVQEYPLPPRITAHDVWADPSPGGPVWFSGQTSGTANVRQIHGRKGEVWTPESAAGKLVVYRYR